MLEGLAAWVLNNYLGKYVENLNTDQLSIALLSGKVELENLPLKKDALRHLGLPIEVKAGFIGKIKLQVPVRQVRSAPWLISIEQLYLVATPLPLDEWDAEVEALSAHELKLSALDIIDARWRLETETRDSNYYSSSYSSWLSFGAGLVSDIIENLQLVIQDVHVRYEDPVSIPGRTIALGLTIETLLAQSCDANWSPGFFHYAKESQSFKILEMQRLSIYWTDLLPEDLLSRLCLAELAVAMASNKMKRTDIVPGVSAQARVKKHRSELPLRDDTPRLVCDLILEEVPLCLSDTQYDQMVKCYKGLERIERLRGFRHFRPFCTVSEDPRAWWLYAISCFYPGGQPGICRVRPTIASCLAHARQNVEYVKIYTKVLANPNLVLSKEDQAVKDDVEWSRDFDGLKVLRELAMLATPKPARNNTGSSSAGRSMLVSWFPQWMGWYSTPDAETSQLEGEILQVLSDSSENDTILRRDAVFGRFNFLLRRGCLTLLSETSSMLELEFKDLSLNVVSKPRSSSHLIELSLGGLYLKDKITLNTMFPILMGPPSYVRSQRNNKAEEGWEYLFYLAYEKNPKTSGCDHRLCIRSKCLDVVYQPKAVKWLLEFLLLPHQEDITQCRIEAMKSRTKKELLKNWQMILDGRNVSRTTWQLELDISAPQIIFAEQFTDNNSIMAVIDFGRFQLSNYFPKIETISTMNRDNDDEETFVTPCSTPPASEASDSEDQTLEQLSNFENDPGISFTETSIHHRLYDKYSVELTDLQILIGKVKDNWRYAHNKGFSTLHVLDRFNISLQIEKRIIHTSDPLYPSLIINTNLPKLVAHLTESKVLAARTLFHIITSDGFPSFFDNEDLAGENLSSSVDDEDSLSFDTSIEMSRLLMVQFTVDHLSLEIQSRGRSIAELQVAGVKMALSRRPQDLKVSLTVHSLLLVDALQTFGPDFELLVASHKHVGMDSMSGSLRDSEPTSPTSPASPDPALGRIGTTSPVALTQALSFLAVSPPNNVPRPVVLDAEALISIEIVVIKSIEPVQIANIQFNNLDIIANQETLVELMGFAQRVFPKAQRQRLHLVHKTRKMTASKELLLESTRFGTTELAFNFHRLNVLLLRGVLRDGVFCGKKICTATMSDAKIQATIGDELKIEGSLGGLQVLDLTPEGHMHQRIVGVGRDPIHENFHSLYSMTAPADDDRPAFNFQIVRNLTSQDEDVADVIIRMASLWYIHSPQFVLELQSCASEFKQYLANLARSIRTAATDMALGLVHARTESLAQSLYMNTRLPSSIYGSALSFSECSTPRKRRRSSSFDPSQPQTPYSPNEDDLSVINLKLDVELDSPVLVLPQHSYSLKVFVAHLGKISVTNKTGKNTAFEDSSEICHSTVEDYLVDIREMNLFSVDTSNRRLPGPMIAKPEVLYSCKSSAKPILYDTMIQLKLEHEIYKPGILQPSESTILLDDEDDLHPFTQNLNITGSVVTDLKVSLSRSQYQQVLDTLDALTSSALTSEAHDASYILNTKHPGPLSDIYEEDTGVSTLSMDPHVRAKLFPTLRTNSVQRTVSVKASFELPNFTIELCGDAPTGEQALVDLSFRDFNFSFERSHLYEINIQVSLKAILMEDLLQPTSSKHRAMVLSSSGDAPQCFTSVSKSCPDMLFQAPYQSPTHGSLPDHLEAGSGFETGPDCPNTPPPSPRSRHQNLVLINTLLVDPIAPNFHTHYDSIQRSTSVDFNCLDLVISVESWVMVIDFFSAARPVASTAEVAAEKHEKTETNITIRSLNVVLVKPELDVAKANISNVEICVQSGYLFKQVEGKLGSMSLLDLTSHGQLYREKFISKGAHALEFKYMRDSSAQLQLDMPSVIYVHTKRFVAELQAFFNHFTQLQAVMTSIRAATSGQTVRDEPLKLSLVLKAGSPMILLPVSSQCSDLLIVDLKQLSVTNSFIYSGDPNSISVVKDSSKKCQLDCMIIKLDNMDLYAGVKGESSVPIKTSTSFLKKPFELKLQVERNLQSLVSHNVPDLSIYGQLSTLDGALDLSQYRLIRGLLAFNIGEDTESVLPSVVPPPINADPNIRDVWTLSLLNLDLQNVTLSLHVTHQDLPLTCVNFIKSRLTVETFSNLSQDVDLISQEILVMDTRFDDEARSNVFTNILQPIKESKCETVQAEVHSRKRQDYFKYTILLNNMRVIAIFDWWEAIRSYIFQNVHNDATGMKPELVVLNNNRRRNEFELKLNITDSEIIVVEDATKWNSNSVILKSTTVITYKPRNQEKPLSCSLNNCEMFSCILGEEAETALSIIDPVTLNLDINKDNILEVQLQFLMVRLSYHDICMFLQMMNSLPQQLFASAKSQTSQELFLKTQISKLAALGFCEDDCVKALEIAGANIDDAALWLTQHAVVGAVKDDGLNVNGIEVKANRVSICIIDDCGDSDVPLLEVSLSQLNIYQSLSCNDGGPPHGSMRCVLSTDYYNRILSGWEPIIEPWLCGIHWDIALTKNLQRKRYNFKAESTEIMNINITSTLIDLYKQVKGNWMMDYYAENGKKEAFQPRSPFVPFALKNDTGSPLRFVTTVSQLDDLNVAPEYDGKNAKFVAPGEIISFRFKHRDKLRHHDSHVTKMNQLGVQVEGWQPLTPVTVDKVGVYFRPTYPQIQNRFQTELPLSRVVLDVSLEGSARKLITVRSALLIVNKLSCAIEIKLDSQLPNMGASSTSSVLCWAPSQTAVISPSNQLAIPLIHTYSLISARPTGSSTSYTYSSPTLSWAQMPPYLDSIYELRTCHSHKGEIFRFCVHLYKECHSCDRNIHQGQPAHRILLLPAVKILNLLPIDLSYNLSGDVGQVTAGASAACNSVDINETSELHITLENFSPSTKIVIPAGCNVMFKCRINLEDKRGRKLFLLAIISPDKGAKLKITISAPCWIINKTGLPLVFRQTGTAHESAGQFEEHEIARMVNPILFSFSDQEASPTINVRVGNYVIEDGLAQWSSNFHVQKGVQVKKLHVTRRGGGADTVFIVGIEVRPGRGRYRSTSIITVSPRYQLFNQSSYKLVVSQSCFAISLTEAKLAKTHFKIIPNSHMPFHWPRLDKEQYICVSIDDIPECFWSGKLRIDQIDSLHINVRDCNGRVFFLRLEILQQGATFFVIFTDADTLPPPMRVDNFSEVTITFGQTSCKEMVQSIARAHSRIPYAWDQPTERHTVTITLPGGVSDTYSFNKLEQVSKLTYENFIYVAFAGTFKNNGHGADPLDVDSQQLVLDVVKNTSVILNKKSAGKRSQLWRMAPDGRLQHEGSSPPSSTKTEHILVLDIENTAPQPNTCSRLMLRRVDPRRRSTQTWKFTQDGRLSCAHNSMCVQAEDGFYGLRQGNAAVLAFPLPNCHKLTETGIPIEQSVAKQRLRPGSGLLTISFQMDGPTRVLTIRDAQETPPSDSLCLSANLDEGQNNRELQITLNLEGLGLSLICHRTPEELLYALFSNIIAEAVFTPSSKQFCLSVGDLQIDNQLFDTTVPVVVYVTPPTSRNLEELNHKLPAIDFTTELQQKKNLNADIFTYLILRLKKITVVLEEKLLLKFFDFIGLHSKDEELVNKDENDYEMQRLLLEVSASHSKRFYFGVIQLILDQIRLSVKTVSKLPAHLQTIKRKLGLTALIKFEDAAVDLQAYDRRHLFETGPFLISSVLKHFKDELMWQAGIILVSVDFLGNPLGFVNDVSEGFSGLLFEGNVSALVKNVTHGISNSAVKVTESISDGLGRTMLDDRHEEVRQKIRHVESGRSRDHIVAGFKGLGFGLLGGATGLFKQVYEGATTDGLSGAISGIGKGLVGAVTKPVVGVLDFASETARAVRDSSRSKLIPERKRLPRCVMGHGSLLPRYSSKQSQGQQYLYLVNDKDYKEQLVSYEILGSASEEFHCIVSNLRVRILASTEVDLAPVIDCHLSDLETCNVTTERKEDERFYIEIVMHITGTSATLANSDPVKKPKVRCKSAEVAKSVSQKINYAKRLYLERLYILDNKNPASLED